MAGHDLSNQQNDLAPPEHGEPVADSVEERPSTALPDLAHFPIADMKWRRDEGLFVDSQTMLNCGPLVDTAVVFLHGWWGSACGTWEDFAGHLRFMPEAARADIFFLDYPSTTRSVGTCARETQEFLLDLLRSPAENIVNPSLPVDLPGRETAWRYSRVLIVAHSMGAVVARRALLDLDRTVLTTAEAKLMRLAFFAPAHMGSSLPGLIASGLALDWLPGAALLGQALSTYFRSLSDLQAGSDALRQLADDSRAARNRRKAKDESDEDLRAYVLHAWDDKVVVQVRFDEDIEGRPIGHRHHRSICKPGPLYRRPVDVVRELLSSSVAASGQGKAGGWRD